MEFQNRRGTRSSAANDENVLGKARLNMKADEGAVRRPFVDQRNARTLRLVQPGLPVSKLVPDRARQAKPSPVRHPELTGLEREFQTADYMDDIYNYLLSKEKGFVLPETTTNKATITTKMRSILIDWLIQVHGRFHLFAETLHLTIYLVDAVLAHIKVEKSDLQLVGMACMLVASKFEEMYVPDIKDFEYIADNAFSRHQIMAMEAKVLTASKFALSRPHSIIFLRWLTKEADSGVRQHNLAKYFSEAALLDHSVAQYVPSRVALLSLYISNVLCNKDPIFPVDRLALLIGWSKDALMEAVPVYTKAILRVHSQEKLTAIRNKYHSSKFSNVSDLSDDELTVLKQF